MTIVEAMASGAVPVVIGGGGIRDIVRPGTDGFLWQTPEELKSRTMELIRDPALRDSLARSAVARAAEFSREAFERRVDAIITELASRLR
jgi:glycosyltransferase involved in cell wall biosynthesis